MWQTWFDDGGAWFIGGGAILSTWLQSYSWFEVHFGVQHLRDLLNFIYEVKAMPWGRVAYVNQIGWRRANRKSKRGYRDPVDNLYWSSNSPLDTLVPDGGLTSRLEFRKRRRTEDTMNDFWKHNWFGLYLSYKENF